MIKYSNTPDKFANVITNSPTAPIKTTRDINGLNETPNDKENSESLLDPWDKDTDD